MKQKITPDCDDMRNTDDNIDDILSFSVGLPRDIIVKVTIGMITSRTSCTYEKIISKEYLWRKVIKNRKIKDI